MIAIIKQTLKGGAYTELMNELLQECYIILCSSVKMYDKSKNIRFSTYFSKAVKLGVYRYTLESGAKIKIPTYMVHLVHEYNKLTQESIPEQELLKALEVTPSQLELIKQAATSSVTSLNSPITASDGNKTECGELIADSKSDFTTEVIQAADEEILLNLCRSILNTDEFKIVKLRYWYNMSYADIEHRTGITKGMISSIRINALIKLRGSKKIKNYYEPYLYKHTGVSEFQRTFTSSVERYVLKKYEIEELTGKL
jgi:RNA polymerase sigma factor (sigma-70 family)